jgi:WD40 repeat protein
MFKKLELLFYYVILFLIIRISCTPFKKNAENQMVLTVFNKIIEEKLQDLFIKYDNITKRLNQIETKIDEIQSFKNTSEYHINVGIRLKNHYSSYHSSKSIWDCFEICKNDHANCSAISYNNYLKNCYLFKQNEYIIVHNLDWSSIFRSNYEIKINNKKQNKIVIENNPIKLKLIGGHNGSILSMAILPNGNLVSGSSDGSIIVWDTNNGSIINKLQGHTSYVRTLAVLKNGDLVSGSFDGSIIIWNMNNGSIRFRLISPSPNCLTVLPNGDLVSGSYQDSIKIWNPNSGKLKNILYCSESKFTFATTSLTVLPNSGDLIGSTCYGNLISWNTLDGTIKTLADNKTFYFDFITVLQNGDLAIVNKDAANSIIVLDKNDHKLKMRLFGHSNYVDALTALKNGDLASSSEDNSIIIWNVNDGLIRKKLFGHTAGVFTLLTLPNGDLVSGSSDKSIIIWDRMYFS